MLRKRSPQSHCLYATRRQYNSLAGLFQKLPGFSTEMATAIGNFSLQSLHWSMILKRLETLSSRMMW